MNTHHTNRTYSLNIIITELFLDTCIALKDPSFVSFDLHPQIGAITSFGLWCYKSHLPFVLH